MPQPISFTPVADGVHVSRTRPLDVNVTLVVGDDLALVVDTLSTVPQAELLLAAIRTVTDRPLALVNTHFHFDHCFGNAVLAAGGGVGVWGHPYTAAQLAGRGASWQRRWQAEWAATEPELAAGLADVTIHPPDRLVRDSVALDLGGRTVTVLHPGHGHTAGDLVVYVPDVDVIVTGDLIEQSGPPDFGDAHPLEWPASIAAVLRLANSATVFVPGHGAPVGVEFVAAQQADLARFDWLIRDGHADGATVEELAACAPFPVETARTGVARGFAALAARD